MMRYSLQLLCLSLLSIGASFTQSQTGFTYSIVPGWNMVSLPLLVSDNRVRSIFPTSTGVAYSYNSTTGYKVTETMENGEGYWIKSNSTTTATIIGTAYTSDTIDVAIGWNLIGSISYPILTDSIISIPDSNIAGVLLSFGCPYPFTCTEINPGIACWIKVKAPGKLIFKSN